MVEELKPCPFCGGEKIRDGHIRDGRRVYCADCSASVTAYQPNASESAASLWNCRPSPASLIEDRLRELVERAQAIISTSTYPNWHAEARASLKAGWPYSPPAPTDLPAAEAENQRLRAAMQEAIDLLLERTHGHPARSFSHNARVTLQFALTGDVASPASDQQKEG